MSQKKPLTLSIVIPVYNEERYLPACLESIATQSIKASQVIVVDNNSTDKTRRVASNYKFVQLMSEPRQGVYFARTKGFSKANCDIIARLDADSVLPPHWIKTVLDDFKDKEVMAVTGPVRYYDMPLSYLTEWFDHRTRKYTHKFSPKNPFLYGANMAMRSLAWQEISKAECSDRDIHEDIDLAVHFYKAGKKIIYDRRLLVGASARRINETPAKFISYVWMYRRTFARHGLYPLAAYWAMFMWVLGYLLIHPWRNLWYRFYRKINNRHPVTFEIRKNPMAD